MSIQMTCDGCDCDLNDMSEVFCTDCAEGVSSRERSRDELRRARDDLESLLWDLRRSGADERLIRQLREIADVVDDFAGPTPAPPKERRLVAA